MNKSDIIFIISMALLISTIILIVLYPQIFDGR